MPRELKALDARVAQLERLRLEDRIHVIGFSLQLKRDELEEAEMVERYESILICLRYTKISQHHLGV